MKLSEEEFDKAYQEALEKANSFTYNYADSIKPDIYSATPTREEVDQSKHKL